MTAGFVVFLGIDPSWEYAAFVIPILLVAAGMALSNSPCSAIATSSVPSEQVGSASGISNMARYVGSAVMTAIVATVYSTTTVNGVNAGDAAGEALSAGFSRACLVMALVSASGIGLALLAARDRPPPPLAVDMAAAAASSTHTLPTPRPDDPERALVVAR
jgi:sugar phosphate permease